MESQEGAAPRDPAPSRPTDIDATVAEAVLAVADRLTSAELRRRLEDAVRLLPDIRVIGPGPGAPFDADEHDWVERRPAPTAEAAGTISEVLSAGLATADGRLLRPARVAAYHGPEEQH